MGPVRSRGETQGAAANQLSVEHPENPAIPGITNTESVGPLRREHGQLISKNCVVVSPGRCDRSPCGTGSSARLALLHAKGLINPGEVFIHESITGSRFTCAIDGITKVGNYSAVIPAIAGQACIKWAWIRPIPTSEASPRRIHGCRLCSHLHG
ncbi:MULTISPECIES: proline racemase family protein [unclassified Pseudomonas]|uniref:proline racemase family protein n=1 Tax=unclassified Pseudomonas TaxID=196821 RepID=UPI002E81C5BD|nr:MULTISPECIES: proline racemase family protein [unclassified Pseudomonas]